MSPIRDIEIRMGWWAKTGETGPSGKVAHSPLSPWDYHHYPHYHHILFYKDRSLYVDYLDNMSVLSVLDSIWLLYSISLTLLDGFDGS